MPKITIPGQKPIQYPKPLYVQEVAMDRGHEMPLVTGAYVNGEFKGLDYLIDKDSEIIFVLYIDKM